MTNHSLDHFRFHAPKIQTIANAEINNCANFVQILSGAAVGTFKGSLFDIIRFVLELNKNFLLEKSKKNVPIKNQWKKITLEEILLENLSREIKYESKIDFRLENVFSLCFAISTRRSISARKFRSAKIEFRLESAFSVFLSNRRESAFWLENLNRKKKFQSKK